MVFGDNDFIFNDDSKCTCGRAGEKMPAHPSICGKCGGWF